MSFAHIVQMNDDYMMPMTRTSPPRARPAAPTAGLSPETLRVSAEWLAGQAERLSADDLQFARGMSALLREGKKLTPKQVTHLILLTASLLS